VQLARMSDGSTACRARDGGYLLRREFSPLHSSKNT
jgi:hypothetical protein